MELDSNLHAAMQDLVARRIEHRELGPLDARFHEIDLPGAHRSSKSSKVEALAATAPLSTTSDRVGLNQRPGVGSSLVNSTSGSTPKMAHRRLIMCIANPPAFTPRSTTTELGLSQSDTNEWCSTVAIRTTTEHREQTRS